MRRAAAELRITGKARSVKAMLCGLLALCSFASAAAAQEGKTWLDATCSTILQSSPAGSFVVSKVDGSFRDSCVIADWPVSSPTAQMDCEGGSRPTMELQGEDVVMGGLPISGSASSMTFIPKGDSRLTCG